MARKKTLEELRDTNRQRQRRWREAHKWLNRERRLACYGQSQAQKKVLESQPVTNNVTPLEGGPLMEPNERGGHGDFESMGQSDERSVGQKGVSGPAKTETAEEKETKRRLEELIKRQAAGGLGVKGRGVAVKLDC